MEIEFKNEEVREICEVMAKALPAFESKKRGIDWRAILMSTAAVFPEDREAIFQLFGKPVRKEVDKGGAKLIRNTATSQANAVSECEGCPGSGYVADQFPAREMRTIVKGVKEEPTPMSSVEDVIERFDGDVDIMKTFCITNGIDIGRATKMDTIAQKIVEFHNPQTP